MLRLRWPFYWEKKEGGSMFVASDGTFVARGNEMIRMFPMSTTKTVTRFGTIEVDMWTDSPEERVL